MKDFCKKLEECGITVEDFTGHIGVIFDSQSEDDEMYAAEKFLMDIYQIASSCIN